VRPRWLRRVRPTTPQTDLGAEARRANVRDAFVASPRVAGRALVLIDDVYTTGATAGECARTLKAAGARAVGVLTVARVP
jgi:predicted amidophosphoribosyltransferase